MSESESERPDPEQQSKGKKQGNSPNRKPCGISVAGGGARTLSDSGSSLRSTTIRQHVKDRLKKKKPTAAASAATAPPPQSLLLLSSARASSPFHVSLAFFSISFFADTHTDRRTYTHIHTPKTITFACRRRLARESERPGHLTSSSIKREHFCCNTHRHRHRRRALQHTIN